MREHEKKCAAIEAVQHVENGMIVGLGTGSTVFYALHELGKRVHEGLKITGVPTSEKTKSIAIQLNIPVVEIDSVAQIDLTIDGADEFTAPRSLIKGGGGALFREKLVANLTKKMIIIVDSGKQVTQLGQFPLPIEVVPVAGNYVSSQIKKNGGTATLRMKNEQAFTTDQGNYIIDAAFGLIPDPPQLANTLDAITGVVEHGLFLNMAHWVLMGKDDKVITFRA